MSAGIQIPTGIRGDGAFGMSYTSLLAVLAFSFDLIGQHDGIIYNGNYGELDSNDLNAVDTNHN